MRSTRARPILEDATESQPPKRRKSSQNYSSFATVTSGSKNMSSSAAAAKLPRRSARNKGGTNESLVTPQGPVKKVNAVQAASGVKPFVAKAQQSTSFAAVASGSSNDSFGMIQTGGTHPGTLAKAGSRKAKTPDLPNASAQVAPQAPQAPQPLLQDANLDSGSIGTFKKTIDFDKANKKFKVVLK